MIHNMANRLASFFVGNGIIESDDFESCAYGFEIMISTTMSISLVILLGIIFDRLIGSFLFLFAYCPLRTQTGGYHADSHFKCIGFFSGSFLVLLFLEMYGFILWHRYMYILLVLVLIIIVRLAPVENEHKFLPAQMKIVMRRNSIIIALALIVGFLVYRYFNIVNAMFILWGLFLCTTLMVLGKLKLHRAMQMGDKREETT